MKKIFLLFLTAIILSVAAYAGDNNEIQNIKDKLPQILDANNIGTDFWFTIPPCYLESDSLNGMNFIKIFVTSAAATGVTVQVPGKGYYKTKTTIPNDVIEFNIAPAVGQVYTRRSIDPYVPEQVYKGAGINIKSDDPIVVYCVIRYNATSDGFMVLPVSSLGKEYISASYGDMGEMYPPQKFPSLAGIVAPFDNTTVHFTLGGNETTETAGGLKPGQSVTNVLNKGDVLMYSSAGYEADLTGSKITADKPVALVSGNYCTNIPTTNRWCDYTVEMDMPTYTWSQKYLVPQVPLRVFPSIIRVFASEPDTKIYRDGNVVGTIRDAGGKIGEGYLELRLQPMGQIPGSAVISGDHPISVTLYNTGIQEDKNGGNSNISSDPFVMAITPMSQFQKEITFCTPAVLGGANFPENYVSLICPADDDGQVPLYMEYAKVQGGLFNWQPVRTRFPGVPELFKIDIDGKKYLVKYLDLPGDGVYKIRGKYPFAAYSFGYGPYDSYGYPTSSAQVDMQHEDPIPPKISFHVNEDGSVTDGSAIDMPEDGDKRSNIRSVTFQQSESYNYKFNCSEIIPGETRNINWSLDIINTANPAKAVLTFMDRCGNDTTIVIEHNSDISLSMPSEVDFGLVKKGNYATKSITLTNTGSKEIILESGWLESGAAGFETGHIPFPVNLNPGSSFEINVNFTAFEADKEYSDNLIIQVNGKEYSIALYAFSSNSAIQAGDEDFGKVGYGEFLTKQIPVRNTGSSALKITGIEKSGSGAFDLNLKNITPENPMIIEGGKTAYMDITFSPTGRGFFGETLTISSNAATGDNRIELKGTGIASKIIADDLDFGVVVNTGSIRKKTIIKNEGDFTLKITGFDKPASDAFKVDNSFNPGNETPVKIEPGEEYELGITFIPGMKTGLITDEIKLNTNSPDGDEVIELSARNDVNSTEDEILPVLNTGVYPTPATNTLFLSIESGIAGNVSYSAVDINGKEYRSISGQRLISPGKNILEIPVSALPSGNYILQTEINGKAHSFKFSIAR